MDHYRRLIIHCLRVPKQINIFGVKQFHRTATSACSLDLNGIFIPVPTPFENNEKQTIHYEMLRQNIRKWEQIPLKGYCIAGTNGEGPYSKHEEKLSMIKVFKSEIAKNKLIMAGTTCETTEETCELSIAAADAGADAVLIMTPHYFKARMTDTNIIDHFGKVADTISVPVIMYNMPFATGIDITLNVIETLATHSNIFGIKDSDLVPQDIYCRHYKWLMRDLGPPGLKSAMDLKGYFGGKCRRPLSDVSESVKQKIKKTINQQAFL